jgi:hypothetical protein
MSCRTGSNDADGERGERLDVCARDERERERSLVRIGESEYLRVGTFTEWEEYIS